MFKLITENLDKIILVAGAMAVLFFPQIKAALAAAKSGGSSPSGCNPECPLCHPVSGPTEKERADWVVTVMDLEKFCTSHRLTKAVKLCHDLCNELVSGEPDAPPVAKVAAKAAVKGGR